MHIPAEGSVLLMKGVCIGEYSAYDILKEEKGRKRSVERVNCVLFASTLSAARLFLRGGNII